MRSFYPVQNQFHATRRFSAMPVVHSLNLSHWKRNKKVAVHFCREYLSVHDTSKGGTVAPRGHQEVRAEQGVVGWGGDVDEPGHGSRGMCLCAFLVFLPPLKGQTEA